MKNILKYIILIICVFVCENIKAKTIYNETPTFTNDYIKQFRQYQKYIISEPVKYGFVNGNLTTSSKFKTGGLLNKDEFILSLDKNNSSYLFNGLEYFTMTENGTNVVVIDPNSSNYFSNKSQNYSSGIRVTNYVQNDVHLKGKGTKIEPWEFDEKYYVRFEYD